MFKKMIGKKIESCTLIRRDENLEDHYEILNQNFRLTRPTIMCLGGNCTLDTRKANNMCKIAQRLVGLKAPRIRHEYASNMDVDIIGVAYGTTYDKYGKAQQTSTLSYKDVINLTEKLLEPLVIENGHPISVMQACKHITNVTFFSHSMGARETAKLIYRLSEVMTTCGYTEQQANQILSNITCVAYAPETSISSYNMERSLTPFPKVQQFSVKSLRDFPYDEEYRYETGKPSESLDGIEFVKSKLSENEFTLYCSNFKTPDNSNEHMIHRILYRNDNWIGTTYERSLDDSAKYIGERADVASQCAGYVLASSVANAIQNSQSADFIPKPSTDQLVEDCKDIATQFEDTIVQE